jgi:hypothetical protein
LASDAIEGSVVVVAVAVAVVVDEVLPTGEEFGGCGGRPIGWSYGIIGIGAGAGAALIAPHCCWLEAAAAGRRVEDRPAGFG